MRTGWLELVLAAGVSMGAAQPAPEPHCSHAKQAAARWRPVRAEPALLRESAADTDVQHNDLDIELNPVTTWIGGSNTMTVRSRVDGLATFRFRLDEVFTLGTVEVDGSPASWTRLDPETVEVALNRPYATDEVFTVRVPYSGQPQSSGGWGSITFRMRSGAYEVFTLSQPWFAYTWWPAKDDLRDKTTADLRFTVPNTMVVASNGLLEAVDPVPPNKLRYHWRTEYPTEDYLYCIGATNYHQFGTTWTYGDTNMPLQFFIYPEYDSAGNRAAWQDLTLAALTAYSDLFGLYPFPAEKYGMLNFGWGGGMEHQTMTSIGPYFWWESGIVHELAHQWWGDWVTCATWHDIWLNEGFATYSEALWYENEPGSPGAPALHQAMANRRPSNASGTVYCYDISDQGRIFDYNLSYLKGAWVQHMLRHVLGDATFYDTLAAWRAQYGGSAGTTDDYRAVAEAVSGRDLQWFFDEWVYGAGTPVYRWAWQQTLADGNRYVELYIEQQQSVALPTFTMPIDLVTTAGGQPTTHVVWNDARVEHLLVPVDATPVTQVQFDPVPWILCYDVGTIPFVAGPPKIISMTPPPGASEPAAGLAQLEIVFHKPVAASVSDFVLEGVRHGTIPCNYTYDMVRCAVTLTPGAPLLSDTYTLTVADSIRETVLNKQLDGELVRPDSPDPLPSGDGVPGGDAVATFTALVPGDLDCDGQIGFSDINPFVLALGDAAAYAAAFPGCPHANADVSGDGAVDFGDINPFVALLSGP